MFKFDFLKQLCGRVFTKDSINKKWFITGFTGIVVFLVLIILYFTICSPYKLAAKCIQSGDYNCVIKITTAASKISPNSSRLYSLRGYSRFQTGDFEGAIEDYDRAYKLGSDEYKVMNFDNKIYIKYYLKDYDGALKDFDNEIKNTSDDYEKDSFLWDKAQFLYNIKKYDEALKIYNELILKSEDDRVFLLKNRLYFERAQVYKSLGKSALSGKDIKNAEDLSIEDSFKNPIPQPVLLLDDM